MGLWSELRYRVRSLIASRRMDIELAEELRDHLERAVEANQRAGMSDPDARRAAAIAFGGFARFTEEAREPRGWRWLADGRYDLRHAFRLMRRYPGFALATILITALGIAATTVVFSAVNGVLLRPLPFPDAEDVARLLLVDPATGGWVDDGAGSYELLARENPVLEGVGAFTVGSAVISSAGDPTNARLEYITPSLLQLLRVRPLVGRLLVDEDATSAAPVVLLSHRLWMHQFGGDSGVVGATMDLDRVGHTIVGVARPEFTGPFLDDRDAWLPVRVTAEGAHVGGRTRGATIIVRVRDGVSRERAESWLNSVMHLRAPAPTGGDSIPVRARISPLPEQVLGDVRRPLLILLGAVGCVMILVAANVATLVLSRALMRGREMAVRGALGASRTRQLRQILTETVLLAGIGGALGLAIAWLGLGMLIGQGVNILPRLREITIDWRVALGAALLTLATGAVAGLAPSITASSSRLADAFKGPATGSTSGSGRGGLRSTLVAAEVAISVVLLIGAGLLVKGFLRVAPRAPGYAVERRAVVQVGLRDIEGARPRSADDYLRFARDVRARIEGTSGVEEVALTPFAPLVRSTMRVPMTLDPGAAERPPENGHLRMITPNFFALMEIPLVAGRAFTDRDGRGAARVAIVNETAASRWWPGESPIGRRIRFSVLRSKPATVEVVGVSRDTRFDGLFTSGRPEVFVPFEQQPVPFMTFIARTTGDPARLIDEFKRRVWEVEPRLPIIYAGTLGEIAGESVKEQRFYTTLLTAFAVVALLLASAGIFSVMAYAVSQRTREIGIRMALGAPRWSVGGLVVRQGLVIAGSGLLIGIAGARGLTRFLEGLLLEVTPGDPGVFASAAVGLCVVAMLACMLPLWRAITVDPARTLKVE